MSVLQKFDLPVGGVVQLFENSLVFNCSTETGYKFTEMESGSTSIVPFQTFVDYLKLPGVKLDFGSPETGKRLQERMGGVETSQNLRARQQDFGKLHLAFCQAMDLLRNRVRVEFEDPSARLSIRMLDRRENRVFIRDIAQKLFGQKILLDSDLGQGTKNWYVYKGRTLIKYLEMFDSLELGESPLDALVTLDHLKGNTVPRVTDWVKNLMTQAWEEIGFDRKSTSVANVYQHLEMLMHEENRSRKRNDLPPLVLPGQDTLAKHRHYLLTPTEYLIATKGERFARGKRGRGSTDIRALLIAEVVEIDECNASLVASAKAAGIWETLAQEGRVVLEEIDKLIKQRLSILVMIDVASRMPLAWVISDQPKAEATLALFRMATRDKQREKLIYGCDGEPVGAVGLGNVKNDNGPGLRNRTCVAALLGAGAMNTIVRAYASTDKPYVERMFGTTESGLWKIIHGYTGRKPGELSGYDATLNGVLDIDELYGILTKFMIDAYPSMRHMGVGMGGRRPFDVYKEIAETRGCFRPMDPNLRRIHLCWEQKVTPTDEGVRVFSGIWFNSNALQLAIDDVGLQGQKISVFVDPDDMARATALVPGVKGPIEVHLQITAFADMTLVEILDLMAKWRREDPKSAEIHEDRLMKFRRELFTMMRKIGVERNLPRSYSTIAECQAKAKAVFAGAKITPARSLKGTVGPLDIMNIGMTENVFKIGSDDSLIEGNAVKSEVENTIPDITQPPSATDKPLPSLKDRTPSKPSKSAISAPVLGRPKNLKELE